MTGYTARLVERPAAADMPRATLANCRGVNPDLFFEDRGRNATDAKAVCHGCEARLDCLTHALTYGERHGVWGGLSVRERRRLRVVDGQVVKVR